MDAHPTIVINDALSAARAHLQKAADVMASGLVEQLKDDVHFAEFEITVTGRIVDPKSGADVGKLEFRLPYNVFSDRNPSQQDDTD